MVKFTNKRLMEISPFIANAARHGYELLALHKKLCPYYKIPRSILSFYNSGINRIEEASNWLFNLTSYLLMEHINLIDQDTINDVSDFLDFIDTLDEHVKDSLLEELKYSIEFYDYDESEIECISDIPLHLLDDHLYNFPIRITTLSSKLFTLNTDLLVELEEFIPLSVCDDFELYNDSFGMTIINSSAENAYHPSKDYSVSLTILSNTSTDFNWYSFHDSFSYPDLNMTTLFADSLKKMYKDLL